MVPDPTARQELPKSPAKNRHAHRAANVLLNPAPRVNNMEIKLVVRYTMSLPYVSLIGAEIMGPKPRAKTHSERGRIAAVVDTSKISAT